jgi:hypothetical protein
VEVAAVVEARAGAAETVMVVEPGARRGRRREIPFVPRATGNTVADQKTCRKTDNSADGEVIVVSVAFMAPIVSAARAAVAVGMPGAVAELLRRRCKRRGEDNNAHDGRCEKSVHPQSPSSDFTD